MNNENEVKLPPFVVNEIGPVMSLSQSVDWGIDRLLIPKIHQTGITGKGVKIAVIDTGVENHVDLEGAIIKRLKTTSEPYSSTNGHGTGVCGVIGARNNESGVLGVAYNSEIISIKALDESGSGTLANIAAAIQVAIANGAQVINMSLGSSGTTGQLRNAIKAATDKGIYVVCAAGNDGRDNSVNYPAKYEETYAVGAINQTGHISSFSSRGWDVDIAAPGEKILTTWKNNTYAKVSGTSFSSPYVAGLFALFVEAKIKVNHDILKLTSIDIEEPGFDPKSGYGLINPAKIINDYSLMPGNAGTNGSESSLAEVYKNVKLAYESLKQILNIK